MTATMYSLPEFDQEMAMTRRVLERVPEDELELSVYLRLLDVPVPGIYGPTADEM